MLLLPSLMKNPPYKGGLFHIGGSCDHLKNNSTIFLTVKANTISSFFAILSIMRYFSLSSGRKKKDMAILPIFFPFFKFALFLFPGARAVKSAFVSKYF